MSFRVGEVQGTNGIDVITGHYFDGLGNHPMMFSDDDVTQAFSDRIAILAGDGDDLIQFEIDYVGNGLADDFSLDGEAGHDRIIITSDPLLQEGQVRMSGGTGNDLLTYAGGAILHMDGGEGADTLSVWSTALGPDRPEWVSDWPILSGGADSDLFILHATSLGQQITITDFAPGEDILEFVTRDDQAVTRFELTTLVTDPLITAEDSNRGLIVQHHVIDPATGKPVLSTTVTLQGVALEDLRSDDVIIIDGTARNDRIDGSFTDGNGDGFTDWIDLVLAGAGNDVIWLNDGTDIVFGQAGHDSIMSRAGDHRINGGDGQDKLSAARGNATLEGAAGQDILRANANSGSHHVLSGGEDADSFIILSWSDKHSSTVTITDFNQAEDSLVILGQQIDIRDLPCSTQISASDEGWMVLHFGDDERLILQGVEACLIA